MNFRKIHHFIIKKFQVALHYFGIRDTFFGKFFRKQYAKKICNHIQKLCTESNKQKILVCYDIHASPPTMGDFLSVVMLVRYLCLKGKYVNFFVITSDARNDWNNLSVSEKNSIFVFMKTISQILLPSSNFYYKQISWDEFIHVINAKKSSDGKKNMYQGSLLHYQKIIKRHSTYNHAFNIINYLLSEEDKYFIESFLLSAQDFKSYEIDTPILNEEFVTWHLRYNTKWGLHRNLTQDQFDKMLSKISSENPNTNIVIISDAAGTEHYKNMINLDCELLFFSKDYGNNFFHDAWLILTSSKYYQYRGGGIGMIPIFSSINYEIIDKCSNEISWVYPNFTSWAHNSNQKRYFNLLDDNTVV